MTNFTFKNAAAADTTIRNAASKRVTTTRAEFAHLDATHGNIISAQHISQRFATDKKTDLTVLDDISFTLYDNEIVAILGRSGAGKSTFLRILAGLVQPSEGSVEYRGAPLNGPNPGVSLVFQTFALMPWLTVQANVELGLEARGMPRSQRRDVALAAIDAIGLDGFESAYPKELSGGMRQRVGIARALVMRPDALFMDEPFSALDVLTAENLRQEVLSLWNGKDQSIRSILMVTHNIEEAVEMADRVIVFGSHPGRLIAQTSIDLPRPRNRHSAEFEARVDYLYSVLTGTQSHPQTPRSAAGKTEGDAATAATAASRQGQATSKAAAVPSALSQPPTSPTSPTSSASSAPSDQHSDAAEHTQGMQATADKAAATAQPAGVTPAGATPTGTNESHATPRATAADQPFLPNATPGGLAGLLDVIAENPSGIDLADLASLLSFEVDDLFPLIDAGAMLRVLAVREGRVRLTDQGWAWHDADILGSKQVFARLALQHAPLVRTIDLALKQSETGRLRGELVLNLLRNRHEDAKAWQQFHIAVTWGRYGELFDYDADDDLLIIDEENR
ncbi:MAG: nitrate/sulfonate/bicarbonate ABC transporter ATP-binding protein [Bifidobacterium tibiigranuli]|jgi:NitT/TauT family transport system ATP-binding protein|nr:nitrate/sulfonate/bicarbonate ABC transporter ATP-binding protein [Bifidobacterium tibiigranuli]